MQGKNYITPSGAKRLKDELHSLLVEQRPELVRVIAWAASNGDRSENGDYIYGKRRLREIDRRIRFLTQRLQIAEIIDPSSVKSDRVLFGATVTYEDENALQKKITIVGQDEIDAPLGQISWNSPVAKALLSKKVGDVTEIHTPSGKLEVEILKIEYI